MAGPNLPDIKTLIAAGITPKTGQPIRAGCKNVTKEDIKKFLRLVDEQDAINRYTWYNIPASLSSQELERMLYYKANLCFFYDKNLEEFYFMPYALDGTIDFYGRYKRIHPVPMTSGTDDKNNKAQAQYLSTLKLDCIYSIPLDDVDPFKSTVLLQDYSKQLAQTIIPRKDINEPLLDVMAECIPMMRTSLIASSGIKAMRVNDADQEQNVWDANAKLEEGAMSGKPFVPVVGTIEFQELTDGNVAKSEEYFLAMQSLDNLRLSGYGIDNGGLFEKKAHELQTEADLNGGPVGLILQDGLTIRQNFCNIVNSIWNVGIWCEPSENIIGIDTDGDGAAYEENMTGENSGTDMSGTDGGEEDD